MNEQLPIPVASNELGRAAEEYRQQGLSVFPLKACGKIPDIEKWKPYQEKPASAHQVAEWWNDKPDANIAIATGQISGFIVIDVDEARGQVGGDTLNDLCMKYEDLPETVTAQTGGGGRHILFKVPPGTRVPNQQNFSGENLDIRGDGGYIVAVTSVHENGNKYSWKPGYGPSEIEMADCPEWLLELIVEGSSEVPNRQHPAPTTEISNLSDGVVYGPFGRIIDGRKKHATDVIWGCLIQTLADGAAPTAEELFKIVWPIYSRKAKERGASLEEDGAGETMLMTKVRYALKTERLAKAQASADQQRQRIAAKPSYSFDGSAPEQQQSDWPEPVDIFDTLTLPSMPLELLPDDIRAFVKQEAELSGVDEGALASICLAVVASAIPDRHKVQIKEHDTNWTQRACLWVNLVGSSSSMKSPILRAGTAPLRDIQEKLFSDQKAAYDLAEMNKEKEAEVAPARRHIVNDATPEALLGIWAANHEGVLAVQDELSGWITSFDRYSPNAGSTGGKAIVLSSWNGESHISDRVGRGTTHVKNASMSVVGGIQPDIISRLADKMGNDGLMARFFHIILDQAGRGADRTRDKKVDNDYRDLVQRLANNKVALSTIENLHKFDPQARELVDAFLAHVFDLQGLEVQSGRLAEWCGKLGNQMARLALTLHYAEAGGNNPPTLISAKTASRAIDLLKFYYLPHATHFFTVTLDDREADDAARWIAGHMLAHRLDRIAFRDLDRGSAKTKKLSDQDRRKYFRFLESFGWVRAEDPVEAFCKSWQVNPKIHERFAERAMTEKARRKEVQRLIAISARSRREAHHE